jgi:hypothetical protein
MTRMAERLACFSELQAGRYPDKAMKSRNTICHSSMRA